MAQYKTIPIDFVEHTELARQSYLNYERCKAAHNDDETETSWLAQLRKLHDALDKLSHRQREVLVLIAIERLSEPEVAAKLGLNQSTVSRHYRVARSKMAKLLAK